MSNGVVFNAGGINRGDEDKQFVVTTSRMNMALIYPQSRHSACKERHLYLKQKQPGPSG
jgi:hypothetical protein